MMTFSQHITFTVTTDGVIKRGTGQLPSVIKLPAISVTVAPASSLHLTAHLLRRLADELEGK